jgi:hypothetical protein
VYAQEGMIVADEQLDDNETRAEGPTVTGTSSADTSEDAPPQYGVGPFSIREVVLLGVWLLAFATSFFSLSLLRFDSVWTSGLVWILTIAVPTVAVFLIVLRRLSPAGIRRVGSLGIDQFASVAFSVSAVVWLSYIWETVAFVADGGPMVRSWVMWVEFILMLAGVVLTVFAPLIPVLRDDFRHRPEIPAHRSARPLRPVVARPAPEPRPLPNPADADADAAYAAPVEQSTPGYAPGYETTSYAPSYASEPAQDSWAPQTAVYETPADARPGPVRQQAFWALAPEERDVVDEEGRPIFTVGPDAWALVIEDRGELFVVRHEDGRIGYLHDVGDVTRG